MDRYGYAYDANSNRTERTNDGPSASGLDELYTYDGLNRLTSSERGDLSGGSITNLARAEDWSLSAVGGWSGYDLDADGDGDPNDAGDLNQDRTFNDVNEITGISELAGQTAWQTPVYDGNGNMTEAPDPSAISGEYYCVYDAWNRCKAIYLDAQHSYVAQMNEYDGLGRRMEVSEHTYYPNDQTAYQYYYNASWQVLEIRRDAETDPYKQFVWDQRYIDAPAGVSQSPSGARSPGGGTGKGVSGCGGRRRRIPRPCAA